MKIVFALLLVLSAQLSFAQTHEEDEVQPVRIIRELR